MLLMITTFVITATLAWIAVARANQTAKLNGEMPRGFHGIRGFAAL